MNAPSAYTGYYDLGSHAYRRVADDYAQYWRGRQPEADHDPSYVTHDKNIRASFMNWLQSIERKEGVRPEDGALVICGPGGKLVGHELSAEMVPAMVDDHPAIVIADWSLDTLFDAAHSLSAEHPPIAGKTVLTQRDFSGGLSANFHDLINSRLDEVRDVHGLREFIKWLRDNVSLETVGKHVLPAEAPASVNPLQNALDVTDPLNFDTVLQSSRAKVRFVTAHLLLDGMFAATEQDFRTALIANRENMGDEEYMAALRVWHEKIEELCTHAASRFMVQLLEAHPEAHLFAATALNTQYHGMDTFDRIAIDEVRSTVEGKGYKFARMGSTHLNDWMEKPRHSHDVGLLYACKGEGEKSSLEEHVSEEGQGSENGNAAPAKVMV